MNDYGNPPPGPAEPDDRGPWYDEAHRRVQSPGTLLQMFGAFLVAFGIFWGALSAVNPNAVVDWEYDLIEKWQNQQPVNQRQQLPPRDAAAKSLRIEGPIYGFVWMAAGIVMFVGGSKMKNLRSYGWSLAGSIVAIFPGMCCCCTGLLPGLWAIMTLLNADVKLAFSRNVPKVEEPM